MKHFVLLFIFSALTFLISCTEESKDKNAANQNEEKYVEFNGVDVGETNYIII